MSAPERIWVEKSIAEKGNHGSTAWHNTDESSDIEYVRADLCDPTDERVKALVEAVQAFADFDALPTHAKRPDVFEMRVRQPMLRAHAALRDMGRASDADT